MIERTEIGLKRQFLSNSFTLKSIKFLITAIYENKISHRGLEECQKSATYYVNTL